MRGADMSLTAAASGFVVFLLSVSVIQGQYGWGVTYSPTEICALKGSTVEIRCSYTYPSRRNDQNTRVQRTFWFTERRGDEYVDLRTDPEYSGRVGYSCNKKTCTLRITDLRERDSAEYKFRFITNQPGGMFYGFPGVTLTVTDIQVQVSRSTAYKSYYTVELKCLSSCGLPGPPSYIWYRNGREVQEGKSPSYQALFNSADSYSCAVKGREDLRSAPVYAPKLPSVSVSPSAEVEEGSSVTLSCSSDANPAASYTWYKENLNLKPLREEPQLVFSSIQSSDSGQYYCTAENKLGKKTSKYISIDVTYAPKLPSVSVSPSAEVEEGSSVTLTCSSDANPAASYTWYKENQTLSQGPEGSYYFSSISSEDRGVYYCKSENQYGKISSTSLFIDVQYAPKLPSVSVSPSAEVEEGSSVTLTCSSDANPAANYTWYKEKEDSPKASGQIFTITNFRPEHSGSYYCEAQNRRGRHNNTLCLIAVAGAGIFTASGIIVVVLLAVVSLSFFLWIRKKRASREPAERADGREQPEEQGDLQYASIHFASNQADPESTIRPARSLRQEEQQDDVEYAAVKINSASAAPRTRGQDAGEDPAALYSTVNKSK